LSKKLALGKVLDALDNRNISFYDTLSDDEKKEFQPFVLMRFMSSSSNSPIESKYSLISTNEIVNKHFWDLSKEKELHARLLSACGLGSKQRHDWITGTKSTKDIVSEFIKMVLKNQGWNANNTEIRLYISNINGDELEDLCNEYGKSKEDTKKIITQYRKAYM